MRENSTVLLVGWNSNGQMDFLGNPWPGPGEMELGMEFYLQVLHLITVFNKKTAYSALRKIRSSPSIFFLRVENCRDNSADSSRIMCQDQAEDDISQDKPRCQEAGRERFSACMLTGDWLARPLPPQPYHFNCSSHHGKCAREGQCRVWCVYLQSLVLFWFLIFHSEALSVPITLCWNSLAFLYYTKALYGVLNFMGS